MPPIGFNQDHLNRSMPIAQRVMLGDLLAALIARANAQDAQIAAITAAYNAALAKLDAEAALATHDFVAGDSAPTFTAPTPIAPLDPID
jgi:hypothetical protein